MTDGHASDVAASTPPDLDDVLAEYLRATEAGELVDREALLVRFPQLRVDLQSFFVNRDEMERFAAPMRSTMRTLLPAPHPGLSVRYFGDYELVEQIAQGGMGVVYKARQISLDRIVALKMILDPTHDSQRFRAEAEAAASLDHPHIVPIYEIGRHEDRPYFTMRYLDGGSLSGRLASGPLTPREAAKLMLPLVRAVHYAHQRGILHRDLKPGNILLDSDGQPYVTDFGLAKQSRSDQELTQTGAVLGTPGYMAPEQASGQSKLWTTTTDVYGLGAILYAMLTSRAPFVGDSTLETLRQVQEREPDRPSRTTPSIPVDLETICLKCLEKEPSRRYAGADSLADDVERYLSDLPVLARPVSRIERGWRWCRRNPIVAGLTAVVAILALLAASGGWWMASRERQAREFTEALQEKESIAHSGAVKSRNDAESARRRAEMSLAESLSANGIAAWDNQAWPDALLWFAGAAAASRQDSQAHAVNLIRAQAVSRFIPQIEHVFPGCHMPLWSLDFHPSGRYLLARGAGGVLTLLDLTTGQVLQAPRGIPDATCAAWSPNGGQFALGNRHGDVGLFRAADGEINAILAHGEPVSEMTFTDDGRYLASAGRAVRLWDCSTKRLVSFSARHPNTIHGLAVNRRGDRVFTACRDAKLRVFATAPSDVGPASRMNRVGDPIAHAMFGRSGRPVGINLLNEDRYVLATPNPFEVNCIDVESGKIAWNRRFTALPYNSLRSDNTGNWLIVGGSRRARIRQLNGESEGMIEHRHHIAAADFSLNGRFVATAGFDRVVLVSSVPEGEVMYRLTHQRPVVGVKFSPDGNRMATVQSDGLLRVWRFPDQRQRVQRLPATPGGTGTLARLSPNGEWVAAAGTTIVNSRVTTLQVYDVSTGSAIGKPCVPGGVILDMAFLSDGQTAVTATSRRRSGAAAPTATSGAATGYALHFWNWRTGAVVGEPISLASEPRCLDVRPDGQELALLSGNGLIEFFTSRTRLPVAAFDTQRPAKRINEFVNNGRLRYSPDGREIVVFGVGTDVQVWDLAAGKLRYPPLAHQAICHDIDWSPDGLLLATASYDRRARVWDFATGKLVRPPLVHPEFVFRARFSPDGGQLLTACRDNQARLWDWRTGEVIGAPCEHDEEIFDARFTPDGRWLLTAGLDRRMRVWERRTGKMVLTDFGLGGQAWQLEVTPDGKHVVAAGSARHLSLIALSDLTATPFAEEKTALLLAELSSGRTLRHDAVINLTSDEWLQRWRQFSELSPPQIAGEKADPAPTLVHGAPSLYVLARHAYRGGYHAGRDLLQRANAATQRTWLDWWQIRAQ